MPRVLLARAAGAAVTLVLVAPVPAFAQSACQVARLAPSDLNLFDSFGRGVAISGEWAIVGTFWDDNDNGADAGSVYVFHFGGSTWAQEQKLLASDGDNGDELGAALSIDGDTAFITGRQHVHGPFTGAVYVFEFEAGTWSEEQELFASDDDPLDGFGGSVSVSGDVAVVGAAFDDDNGPNSGSVYMFRLDGSGRWVEEQKLLASDGTAGSFFGWSVAISGELLVVGANQHTSNCPGNPGTLGGAEYVFRFDPQSSRWVEEQKLVASDCASGDSFGESVAVSEGVLIVGARLDDDNGFGSGSAYVFRYSNQLSAWVEEQQLLASHTKGGAQFGKSVAIDGETVLVGAWADADIAPSQGSAFLFRREGGRWVEKEKLVPGADAMTPFFFGWSVGLSGDTGIVGAHGENGQRGAAYVFAGLSGADCNDNGLADACEILDGLSEDINGNQVPDECECPWDVNGNGVVSTADLLTLLGAWGPNPGHPADLDGDGIVGTSDLVILLDKWGPCA